LRIHTISDKIGTRRRCGAGRLHKAPVAAAPEGTATTQLDKDLMVGIRLFFSAGEPPDRQKRYRHGIDF